MSWLELYNEFTKKHEAPSIFHLWCAIAAVAAVLERKVWVKLMSEKIYPNMYIILVAPPGRCRKSSAINKAAKLVKKIESVYQCADKTTPEALIKKLAQSQSHYSLGNDTIYHNSISVFSKELGTFFETNPVGMLNLLTDLFDSQLHDDWKYETKGCGVDEIDGVWLNILAGTTPSFFATPVVQSGVGGGFTSRCVFVYASERRCRSLYCSDELTDRLVENLKLIHVVKGEFGLSNRGKDHFGGWYLSLPDEVYTIDALVPYYERKHVHVLKLALIIAASNMRGDLTIHKEDIDASLNVLGGVEKQMPMVFRGTGREYTATDIERIQAQIANSGGPVSTSEIIARNYQHVKLERIKIIMDTLVQMGAVNRNHATEGVVTYTCKKGG